VRRDEIAKGPPPVYLSKDLRAARVHRDPVRSLRVEEEIDLSLAEGVDLRSVKYGPLG
jgi:hypothetical protein